MEEATDPASVTGFVEQVLDGTGWRIDAVRRRSSRLEPPDTYWTQFEISINRGDEDRILRLVAKGALNPPAWERLNQRLLPHGAGQPCDPALRVCHPPPFPQTPPPSSFSPSTPA